jgi:hypothetical protein
MWRHRGLRGLGRYLRRLGWRMPTGWLVLLLGAPPATYAGAALNGTIDDPIPFSPWYTLVPGWPPC